MNTKIFIFNSTFSGTLSRNPSTQSDSSGFADEGDTPSNGANGNHSNSDTSPATMATTEVQTSFDTIRLDSYDQGSLSSRKSSVETHITEEDVQRVAERRESFRKSRGTSIVTSATFSSFVSEDDPFFVDEDVPDLSYCGRNTPVDEEFQETSDIATRSKSRPLRRSGTFPGISEPPTQHGPKTNLDSADRRKRLLSSKMYSVDIERYDASMFEDRPLEYLSNFAKFNMDDSKTVACSGSVTAGAESQKESSNLNNSKSVCEEEIVPSINTDSVTLAANPERCNSVQRPQPDPVHTITDQNSTELISKNPFPQSLSPTLDSWDTSDVSSHSRTPDLEPFQNYSPLMSPPPLSSASVLPDGARSSSPSEAPSCDRTWQVTNKAHHLEQCRTWQGSENPRSLCVSELNARCEPNGLTAERLRSSFEIQLSGTTDDHKSLPDHERLHSPHWASDDPVEVSCEVVKMRYDYLNLI